MVLCRFLNIHTELDSEYLQEYASEYEDFYELTQTIRIKAKLDEIDVSIGQVGAIIELIHDKKVAIVCGVGIQKYADGADVMRAIDAVGVYLGLFAKEGCGVSYLGNSKEKITSPFNTKAKKVSKVNTEFSAFKTVFIQATNPLSQMPDTQRVKESLQGVENLIYFGLYENETSEMADLVIPAKIFLAKDDIRASYSDNSILVMNKVLENSRGISEYKLSQKLCEFFEIKLESETFYLEHFRNHGVLNEDSFLSVEGREEIPYKEGFDTDDGEFLFLEEYDNDFDMNNGFFLITSKSSKSLNSQFKREESVYLHPSLDFLENEKVLISSKDGEVILTVKYDENIRKDCVLIYSGTQGVNYLTSSKHSLDGKSAIFQENKVELQKIIN